MMHRTFVLLAVAGALSAPAAAFAQTDPTAMMRQATANQLGVMEYCQDQGYADADAVSAQRAALNRLPANSTPTDAAEALGRKGTLSVNGHDTTLASLASTHNTSVGSMCQQMASSAKQVAAALQQSGGAMPRMPSMPNGMPAMPSGMPNGMPAMPGGMPAMPNMPGMPGAPSATPR